MLISTIHIQVSCTELLGFLPSSTLQAHAVMQPIEQYIQKNGPLSTDMPRVEESETLSTLISLAIDNEDHILVERAGEAAGVITRSDILRTVVEGTEMS